MSINIKGRRWLSICPSWCINPTPLPTLFLSQSSYLNLCNAEGGGQLGSLGQCEEVSPLEPTLQVLELQ